MLFLLIMYYYRALIDLTPICSCKLFNIDRKRNINIAMVFILWEIVGICSQSPSYFLVFLCMVRSLESCS